MKALPLGAMRILGKGDAAGEKRGRSAVQKVKAVMVRRKFISSEVIRNGWFVKQETRGAEGIEYEKMMESQEECQRLQC